MSGRKRMSENPAASMACVHCSGVRNPPLGRWGGWSRGDRNVSVRLKTNSASIGCRAWGRTHSDTTRRPSGSRAPQYFAQREVQVVGHVEGVDGIDDGQAPGRHPLLPERAVHVEGRERHA